MSGLKLRPYTDAELRAIRKNYSQGAIIDNKRLAEVGALYRLGSDGIQNCIHCGAVYEKPHRCTYKKSKR